MSDCEHSGGTLRGQVFRCSARRAMPAVCMAVLLLAGGARAQTGSAEGEPGADALALAAELTPVDHAEQATLLAEPDEKPFHFYAGLDLVSMYISRGLVYSSKASAQPWFEFDVPVLRERTGQAPFDRLSVFFGNWNSFQEGDPGLGQTRTGRRAAADNWYEADVYGGLRLKLTERFQTSVRFNFYTSPSGSFEDIEEVDLRFTYNDAAFWAERGWEGFATTPSLRITKETADGGGPEQWYFQPSVTPSFPIEGLPVDLTASVPLVLGFGADGQYRTRSGEERHFGFFQTGLRLRMPLDLLAPEHGSINLTGGVDAIFLSDRDLSFRGDQVETVGRLGLEYSF